MILFTVEGRRTFGTSPFSQETGTGVAVITMVARRPRRVSARRASEVGRTSPRAHGSVFPIRIGLGWPAARRRRSGDLRRHAAQRQGPAAGRAALLDQLGKSRRRSRWGACRQEIPAGDARPAAGSRSAGPRNRACRPRSPAGSRSTRPQLRALPELQALGEPVALGQEAGLSRMTPSRWTRRRRSASVRRSWSIAELLSEDPILFAQAVDQILLVAAQPSREGERGTAEQGHRRRLRPISQDRAFLDAAAASADYLHPTMASCEVHARQHLGSSLARFCSTVGPGM